MLVTCHASHVTLVHFREKEKQEEWCKRVIDEKLVFYLVEKNVFNVFYEKRKKRSERRFLFFMKRFFLKKRI